jgi:hypothetical protein
VLREFSEKQKIPYPLLSDLDSQVIRDYGILNDQIQPGDAFLYGIPYPGVYVTDPDGVVVAKFFHDSYKIRDSPEILIDAALGRTQIADDAARESVEDEEVRLTATIHGGRGTIRQGIVRHVVVRFEMRDGFHVYPGPVPEGMIAASVTVEGPPGLVVHDPILPPTETLRLEGLDLELAVWSGSVDIRVPFHAVGELASEVRPLDVDAVPIEITVRYQACDDQTCLLPKTEKFVLDVPLDVIDIPKIGMHAGHGQREGAYDGSRHLRRLMLRKVRGHPLGLLRFIARSIALEVSAAIRRWR